MNELMYNFLNEIEDVNKVKEMTVEEFSKFILESKENINVKYIREGIVKIPNMKNSHQLISFDLWFKKAHQDEMPFIDSYDYYKYMYNSSFEKKEIRPYFAVIPGKSKELILKELEYLGVTESYIFPEREKISNDIKKIFGL